MPKSIYEHFETQTTLPVRLSDVKQFILNAGAADVVTRYAVDIDPARLRGMVRVYRRRMPYAGAEEKVFADIMYSDKLPPFDQRLVCCKEMLHLLDEVKEHAATEASVARLVREVVIPQELASFAGISDVTKILHALAVLMPRTALAHLRDAHDRNRLSPENISELAQLPLYWVRFMLTDEWQELLHKVCGYPPTDEEEAANDHGLAATGSD